jgi:ADP-ribose pyrophosphatase YjhB (NUDIX family)
VTAHGVVRDGSGRVLLAPAGRPGGWNLPGGTVEHGESPQNAAIRLTRRHTGLATQVRAARLVAADQVPRPGDVVLHTDRLMFDLVVSGGTPAEGARWFTPAELTRVPLPGYAAAALDAGVPTADLEDPDDGWPVERGLAMDDTGRRVQRFSTYARATDAAGRMLFAKIADGYPGAGRWHLPGGGTDVGEAPADALLREVAEETGQVGTIGRLLSVSHRHNPVARGWEGYPINWHTIRVVYEMAVDEPTEPRVTEAAGSTVEAAWMRPGEIDRRALTDLASSVL